MLLGYSDSELVNRSGYAMVHHDDLAYVASAHQERKYLITQLLTSGTQGTMLGRRLSGFAGLITDDYYGSFLVGRSKINFTQAVLDDSRIRQQLCKQHMIFLHGLTCIIRSKTKPTLTKSVICTSASGTYMNGHLKL